MTQRYPRWEEIYVVSCVLDIGVELRLPSGYHRLPAIGEMEIAVRLNLASNPAMELKNHHRTTRIE